MINKFEEKRVLTDGEHEKLFCNIEKILSLHSQFLFSFETILSSSSLNNINNNNNNNNNNENNLNNGNNNENNNNKNENNHENDNNINNNNNNNNKNDNINKINNNNNINDEINNNKINNNNNNNNKKEEKDKGKMIIDAIAKHFVEIGEKSKEIYIYYCSHQFNLYENLLSLLQTNPSFSSLFSVLFSLFYLVILIFFINLNEK